MRNASEGATRTMRNASEGATRTMRNASVGRAEQSMGSYASSVTSQALLTGIVL